MKKFILLSVLSIIAISCKSTSTIITSKEEAVKQNLYNSNLDTRLLSLDAKISDHRLNNEIKYLQKDEVVLDTNPTATMGVDLTEKAINSNAKLIPYSSYQLIEKAQENLGSPYLMGGTTRNGFDCSGLIYVTFKNFNYTLPRTANEMSKFGRVLDKSEYRKGDLIFFKTNGRTVINHVGMVIDVLDDEVRFIHSSTNHGVIESSTKDSYYGKTFAQINRVIE